MPTKVGIRDFADASNEVVIGVGRRGYPSPLPPNRTGGSPASGSPVGGLTHKGTDNPRTWASRKLVHPCLAELSPWPQDQPVPAPSLSPRVGGRQQPLCPEQRFDTGPLGLPRSLRRVDSPFEHCRRADSVRSKHRVSTFLHPLAPPALPGFIATMSALTPARGRACGLLNLAPVPCSLPRRSLRFTCLAFQALRLQPPVRSPDRFNTYVSASWASRCEAGLGFAIPSQARQTARPNRVCHPTDCSFASGCSPPRLAANAVTSGFRLGRFTWVGLSPH